MKEILTVSQLNNNIKLLFEETFDFLWVEGEVSNLRRPQSGHVYFTLKDNKSQIKLIHKLLSHLYMKVWHSSCWSVGT